jgi:hypothetical protein
MSVSGLQPAPQGASGRRIGLSILAALVCGALAVAALPRAHDAAMLLWVQDDPAALADRQLVGFDAPAATREIEAALAANDPDLAASFVELAQARRVPLPVELLAQVEAAADAAAGVTAKAGAFARGLLTGEPDDLASLAGTAAGDLFVFGDIRDAVREGGRWAAGQEVDHLILGLSAAGLAVTAGTYAALGAPAPARIGLSLMKAARKTGRLGANMGESVARLTRVAAKGGRADGLVRLTRDVGRVQAKAGTRAALDTLKLADNPAELARVAKLAEKQGGKTRAVLKFLGRGAIMLTTAAWTLAMWVLWGALLVFSFLSSLKGATERITLRVLRRRKARQVQVSHAQASHATAVRRLAMAGGGG